MRIAPVVHALERGSCERLHLHEPLIGQPRLHHRVAAVAVPHRVLVRFHFLQRARRSQHLDDPLARRESIEALDLLRHAAVGVRHLSHCRVFVDHHRHRERVTLAHVEVVRVVRGRDLHDTGAERGIGVGVGDHRDRAVHDR